jgi:hypothetical protein
MSTKGNLPLTLEAALANSTLLLVLGLRLPRALARGTPMQGWGEVSFAEGPYAHFDTVNWLGTCAVPILIEGVPHRRQNERQRPTGS